MMCQEKTEKKNMQTDQTVMSHFTDYIIIFCGFENNMRTWHNITYIMHLRECHDQQTVRWRSPLSSLLPATTRKYKFRKKTTHTNIFFFSGKPLLLLLLYKCSYFVNTQSTF